MQTLVSVWERIRQVLATPVFTLGSAELTIGTYLRHALIRAAELPCVVQQAHGPASPYVRLSQQPNTGWWWRIRNG
ncbi:MAG TPA: hypothetical protein VGA22_07815 [Gemmatimonadales bacterium]|jgi:hypothetical protein